MLEFFRRWLGKVVIHGDVNITVEAECPEPDHRPIMVLYSFINKSKFIVMSLTLNPNQFDLGTVGLVDQVTLLPVAPIPPATAVVATGVTATFPDATVATAKLAASDATGQTIEVDAVAPGTANLLVTGIWDYQDSAGNPQKGVALQVIIPVTVVAAANSVGMTVTFGAPQILPPAQTTTTAPAATNATP